MCQSYASLRKPRLYLLCYYGDLFLCKQVYTFHNVCIEALQTPVTRVFNRKFYYNETAKITIYNLHREGLHHVHVAGSRNSLWNHWDVHFRQGNIPSSHKLHNGTVFFVVPTCPANLHHFWTDEFVPLYSVVKHNDRLYPGANNQILYRQPQDLDTSDSECLSTTAFEDILRTLYINRFHDVFFRAPVNECYSNAVFGTEANVPDYRIVINHVTENVLGKETVERITSSKSYVTFVQRQYRRIINIRELLQTALDIGFRQVRIVYFERHSVKKQVS